MLQVFRRARRDVVRAAMFSSPRRKKTASPGGTPGGIAFDAKSVLKHDVGKERKFRTKVHRVCALTTAPRITCMCLVGGLCPCSLCGTPEG